MFAENGPFQPPGPNRVINLQSSRTGVNKLLYLTGGLKVLYKRIALSEMEREGGNSKSASSSSSALATAASASFSTADDGSFVLPHEEYHLNARFKISRRVGEGAFSTTYEAEDLHSSARPRRRVAIKIMYVQCYVLCAVLCIVHIHTLSHSLCVPYLPHTYIYHSPLSLKQACGV